MSFLEGVRVLDLTRALAGPFVTLALGDLGAEVIKIEEPPAGDEMRRMPPHFWNGEPDRSAYFVAVNRNKHSLALNLKSAEGQAVFLALARKADVVVDNFRPGVTRRLGIDYAALSATNPRIICCSLSAFGDDSPEPWRSRPGYDLVMQALSGVMSVTGEPGRPPARLGISMGDLAGGMYAAYAVAAALYRRERTGHGEYLDISLLDSLVTLHTYQTQYYWFSGTPPGPVGSGHASSVPYQAFAAADGYFVLDAHNQKHWRLLCQVLGRPELADDPRFCDLHERLVNKAALVEILSAEFARQPVAFWAERLAGAGIPSAPILDLGQALQLEPLVHRGMVTTMALPDGPAIPTLSNPIRAGTVEQHRFPPGLGEDGAAVLKRVLGYDDARVEQLVAAGAVVVPGGVKTS